MPPHLDAQGRADGQSWNRLRTVLLNSSSSEGESSDERAEDHPDPNSRSQRRGTRQRGNQPSRPQDPSGGSYYTGRQRTRRPTEERQNGGIQNGGGSQNGAPNPNGGGGRPNRPGRSGRPNRSRHSNQTTSREDTPSTESRNPEGYDDDDTIDQYGTSIGPEVPGHAEADPPENRGPDQGSLRPAGNPYDDSSSNNNNSRTDTSATRRSTVVWIPGDGLYGPDSPYTNSNSTEDAPYSSESDASVDTVKGPAMSPLHPNFDVDARRDRNPPGTYNNIIIGRWIRPARYNGNMSRQNIVRPRIDAAGRMTYQITELDGQGRLAPRATTAAGRVRRMATERLLRARLAPQEAQHGYFEYEPRYAAPGVNARELIDRDIAAQRWADMQQRQIADQAHRRAAHAPVLNLPQTRHEFEERERVDRRRTSRRMSRRYGRAGRRRALRRLDRRWARRRARYPQWFG